MYIKKNKKFVLLMTFLLAIPYLTITLIFRYCDVISFTAWSVEFWDVLLSGKGLGNFYIYAQENLRCGYHSVPNGSYLTFFPWIIWNFPLYLFNMNASSSVISTACIFWSKLFLLICVAVMGLYLYRIVLKITANSTDSMLAAILAVGGLEVLISSAYTGQDEVVYLTTFIIAIYQRFLGKKISSLVWSVVSITLCPIMFIPFVILWVCYEKKVWKLVLDSVITFIPTLIFEFCYRNDSVYLMVKSNNTLNTFQIMMNVGTFYTALGAVSIAGIIMIFVAFAAYFDIEEAEIKEKLVIKYLTIVLCCICFLMFTTFYRSCMYVPFLAVYVCMDSINLNLKAAFMMVMMLARSFIFLNNSYNLNLSYIAPFVVKLIPAAAGKGSLIDINGVMFDSLIYIMRAVAFGCLAILFYLGRSKKELSFKVSSKTLMVINCIPGVFVLMAVLVACVR